MMRYALDACVTRQVEKALEQRGASAIWLGWKPAVLDPDILRGSVAEDRILITTDTDFGELVFKHGQSSVGIILIRCDLANVDQIESIVDRILGLPDGGRGAFTTMDAEGERGRPLP